MANLSRQPWYTFIPHPVVMLLGILILVTALTYVLPAGVFARELINGRMQVVPDSYALVAQTPVGLLGLFKSLPAGFAKASSVIYVILASGIMFGIIEQSEAIENGVGALVRRLGDSRRELIIVLVTFLYSLLGIFVGYENNIAMVPIAAVLALAIGGDLVLAAGMSVGAITIGFGVSPINPYTVGIGHQLAGLSLFSGWPLRSVLCLVCVSGLAIYNVRYFRQLLRNPTSALGAGLDTSGLKLNQTLDNYRLSRTHVAVLLTFAAGLGVMLVGVFSYGWFLDEISAVFLMTAIVAGVVSAQGASAMAETALKSVALVAPGAFLVGMANAVRVVLEAGQIGDTLTYQLAGLLAGLSPMIGAMGMAVAQSFTNFLIPSGSGQALATLPVMLPLGDLIGLTRQSTVLAFQLGDGLTNLMNPTLGGLVAMLALCRVPFDKWLRFILPLLGMLIFIAMLTLLLATVTGYS